MKITIEISGLPPKSKIFKYLIVVLVLAVSAAIVNAASVPNTFVTDTLISSSDVNANFSYLADRVWDKDPPATDLYYNGGNVGIGTATPSRLLHAFSPTAAGSAQILVEVGDANESWLEFKNSAADSWIVGININEQFTIRDKDLGAERMMIDNNGLVGIGTSIPVARLHVLGTIDDDTMRLESAVDNTSLNLINTATGGGIWHITSSGGTSSYGQGKLVFADGAAGSRMVIDSAGNVGIGGATPTARLTVSNGVMRLSPTDSPTACVANLKGGLYYRNSSDELCKCDGSTWLPVDGGGTC